MTGVRSAAQFKVLADQINKPENEKKKTTNKKLAVFGELQNRNIVSAARLKDAQKDVKFQDVKPRVDTRWRKAQNDKAATAKNIDKENAKIAKTHATKPHQAAAKCDKTKAENPIVKQLVQKAAENTEQLLANVQNIDEKDVGNMMLLPEYVNDIYDYYYELETTHAIQDNYLKTQPEISARMRAVLIDWLNEAHVQLHVTVETFHMSVGMIDLYLQKSKTPTSRSQLQLVGVTAMFIAAKYEELFLPPLKYFCYITDDAYDRQQILDMELKMLKTLDFNLSRPLTIFFLRRFSKAAKAESQQHSAAKYFLELVTTAYELVDCKPSKLAAASLLLSLHLLNTKDKTEVWTPTLTYYSRYTSAQLQTLVKKIASIVKNAPVASLNAVYRKYQSTKLENISLLPHLYGARLNAVLNDKSKIC